MPKPEPMKYNLNFWSISFSEDPYESSMDTGVLEYRAYVRWNTKNPQTEEIFDYESSEIFQTFEEAKAWIDEELK